MFTALNLTISPDTIAQNRPANGQEQSNGLNVFLDCHRMWCEMDHIRLEIPYVNWVRDREVADVHILATRQGTGGGSEFIFNFIGLRAFEGISDTLRYNTSRTDVRNEEREGQTRTLQMGLMRFVAGTPAARNISISYDAPTRQEQVRASPEHDPWNYWIFRISANGNVDAESLERHYRLGGNVSANRTTDNWIIRVSARGRFEEDRYKYEDYPDSVGVYNNNTASANARVIRSVADHWGAGVRASVGNSVRYNQDLFARFATGIEYSVFPYAESTRRSFTILYTLGVAGFDYEEMTIFEQTSEILLQQELEVALGYVQPWGNIGGDLEATTYLHDLGLHRVELSIGMSIRITRGLDFNYGGSVARIKDQIYLSGEGVSTDEILLSRRARGTDFEVGMGFGFSYTFGSIFNNAVNPRMEDFR